MDNQPHGVQVLILVLGELAFLIVAAPLYYFLVLRHCAEGELPGVFPLVACNAGLGAALLATAGALVIALLIFLLIVRYLGEDRWNTPELKMLLERFSTGELALLFVAAGIGEEALFRAALIPEPTVGWLLLSMLLFTAVHVSYWKKPVLLANTCVIGVLLGSLYLFTSSLLLCAIVHAAYNFAVSCLLKQSILGHRG